MHPSNLPTTQRAWLALVTLVVLVALAAAGLASCASEPPKATLPPTAAAVDGKPREPALADVELQQAFERWVEGYRASAAAAGIDEATLRAAFDGVRYLPRVVELDRAQPEFTRTVWDYLDTAVSPRRVAMGQEKLLQHRGEAEAATARYGVPAGIVIAIWGIESNYGGNYGSISTIAALATLGFEGRRENWARSQLLAALKIIQRGDIEPARMIGSWAGAMGQTQFLPSVYLAHAVDADGDGRSDIWGSLADVMASTANFLAHSGWQAGQPWGVEVRLPAGFDLGRADMALRQSSQQWAAEGVSTMDGAPLPALAEASILLPAGAGGPVFLIGPNFRVILRYNNSNSYALAVGLLSERVTGGLEVQATWPRGLQPLSRSQLRTLQSTLTELGFPSGKPDGIMGPATSAAIRAYQRKAGLPADGFPTLDLLLQLGAAR